MRKRQSRTGKAPARVRWRRVRPIAVVILVIVCLATTGLLAQKNSERRSKSASGEFSTMSLSGPPSKEYVYAGGRLSATVESTAINGNDAEFVSMCVWEDFTNPPGCVPIGTGSPFGGADPVNGNLTYLVKVVMRNTGTTTWTTAAGFKLGSQNPANNNTWGLSRANLPASIAPGQTATFSFGARKPDQGSGSFNFQWQMVQDGGVGYFGEKTTNAVVPGGAWLPQGTTGDFAVFAGQSVDEQMIAGQSYDVKIIMQNGGTNTWPAAGGGASYKLGAQNPENDTTWSVSRAALPESVAPGQDAVIEFTVTAPSTPGRYTFQWMMIKESQSMWFGTLSSTTFIEVSAP